MLILLLSKYVTNMIKKLLLILISPLFLLASLQVKDITYEEMLSAMKTQTGYDIVATTNVARFQASVLLQIAKTSLSKNPEEKILFLDDKIWYKAYREHSGLSDEEMPDYSILAIENNQDQLLDLRQEKIIKKIVTGRTPVLAMNAIVGWEPGADFYAFNDTLSSPTLKVRNTNQITYRILDFGNMFMYDDMKGLYGQPTSGFLGWLFQFIGEGHVMWSHLTITPTNEEVVRARAKKGPFEIESVLTIYPDGHTVKNVPKDRPDLKAYEKLIAEPVEIEYYPMDPKTIKFICGE